jgi:azurin
MKATSLGLVMSIDYTLKSADGAELKHGLHKTIHRMPGESPGKPVRSAAAGRIAVSTRRETDSAHESHPAAQPGRSIVVDDTRVVEIRSTGIALSYDVTEIQARAGERLSIRYVNASDMVHNIVVVKDESDIYPVGVAAITAHANEFVPRDKLERIVAHSKLANPGETITLQFTVPAAGIYPYICTVSGHFTVMQGRLVARD